jgi:hypothetical protein
MIVIARLADVAKRTFRPPPSVFDATRAEVVDAADVARLQGGREAVELPLFHGIAEENRSPGGGDFPRDRLGHSRMKQVTQVGTTPEVIE